MIEFLGLGNDEQRPVKKLCELASVIVRRTIRRCKRARSFHSRQVLALFLNDVVASFIFSVHAFQVSKLLRLKLHRLPILHAWVVNL